MVAAVFAVGLSVTANLVGPTRPTPAVAEATVDTWLADPLTPPDPRTATPARVAAFFARLPPADTTALAGRYPRIVGNLDGAPAALRYAANRVRYPQASRRQILAFDDRGDGRIVEVLGDLDTATRVVIIVPGVDDKLTNFDTGHGGVQRRAPAWQLRRLYDQIQGLDPAAPIAAVAWLGYDPPEGVRRDALREDRAAAGAIALNRFIDGLLLGHPGLTITVIGHSYGSVVAALAAPHMAHQVTDIVSIGSPGMAAANRSALRTTARVWAGSAPNDWTRRIPGVRVLGVGHGRLPTDPGFGARPLPCADVDGHDGYFTPGTTALRGMARIALGVGDAR
ncbi:alpha/beta hydrolase [Dactylosporangium roseum]